MNFGVNMGSDILFWNSKRKFSKCAFFEGLVITMERLVIDASTTKALLKLELEHVGRGPCSINLCGFKYFV